MRKGMALGKSTPLLNEEGREEEYNKYRKIATASVGKAFRLVLAHG